MPILTKNETPVKGQKAEFELDKAALAAVTSVAADSYFSDDANWNSVEMIFKSNPGKQRRTVKFDASQATPLASFFASVKARDIFEIEKIIINDFDSGTFTILRGELTVAEFDVTLSGGSPASSVAWDLVSRPEYSLSAQSEVVSSLTGLSNGLGDILFSVSEYTIPANGLELKMVANNGWGIDNNEFFGVCNPSQTVFNGFYYADNVAIPSFGVNNILQTQYVYPGTSEVEFKMIIKTNQTEFYVNGVLQSTLAPVSNGSPTIKVATRFDSDLNIKSCTIVEL